MQTIMNNPAQRQLIWNRRLAQLDYNSQISSARSEGENRLSELYSRLQSSGRSDDANKVMINSEYREKMYKEFDIK